MSDTKKMKHSHNSSCEIKRCVCEHSEQDRIYGKGMRVHNPIKQGNFVGYRCIVCWREK